MIKGYLKYSSSVAVLAMTCATGGAVFAQDTDSYALEEIFVTAQKREMSIQDSALSVSAVSGAALEKDRNLNFSDLARSITGFSYTGNTTFDQELNMRGVTNTRVDAPTADPSVGVFMDGVYVGRTGLMNMDLYDIERVEVIRGPQGVLMGKNVVGGALNIFSKRPEEETSGAISLSYGNYNDVRSTGYVTGGLGEGLAGRLSFQYHEHDGYAQDILNDLEMETLESLQLRAQLQYDAPDSDLTARLVFEYSDDEGSPPAAIAIRSPSAAPSLSPWSTARDLIGDLRGTPLTIRETMPQLPIYAGDTEPSPPSQDRKAWGVILDIEIGIGDTAVFNSITGYRDGQGQNFYDQTGMAPDNGYGVSPTLIFSFPVNETEDIKQRSQEFRLTSDNPNSNIDWIVGTYIQSDTVHKFDKFFSETPWGFIAPNLTGESHWDNQSKNKSLAAFAQVGYQATEKVKFTLGARYTRDKKNGTVEGIVVATGDKYDPTDTVPLTPLNPFILGDDANFITDYGHTWKEFTPQAVLEYALNDNTLLYINISRGYKGGAWEDTPPNAEATDGDAFVDPETVLSYEVGGKFDFMDNRARLNIAGFYMDYKDLQVAQTKDSCNCNIIDNASDATIYGVEVEFTLAATENLLLWVNGSWLDTEYVNFIDDEGNDNSGGFLQRTPDYQFSAGAEFTADVGSWEDALTLRMNYVRQGKVFWTPGNIEYEEPYDLLDARATLSPIDAQWSLSVYGKNLTKTVYRNHVIAFLGEEVSFYAPPRTYGVEVGYQF